MASSLTAWAHRAHPGPSERLPLGERPGAPGKGLSPAVGAPVTREPLCPPRPVWPLPSYIVLL